MKKGHYLMAILIGLIFSACNSSDLVNYKGKEYHVNEIVALLETYEESLNHEVERYNDLAEKLNEDQKAYYEAGIEAGMRKCNEK